MSAAAVLALATGAMGQTSGAGARNIALNKPVQLDMRVPSQLKSSAVMGRLSSGKTLYMSVNLPFADAEGMQAFVDDVSNPKSDNYRQFLTPEEVGSRFGIPYARVQEVADYLRSKGLKVRSVMKNRLAILVEGSVQQAEAAFNTTINNYRLPSKNGGDPIDYFSYSKTPSVPASLSKYVRGIGGLENYTRPVPMALTPTQARTLYNLAPMTSAGFYGQGRRVGISNWDGFRLSNVPLYYSQFALPTPAGGVGSNITVVTISGGAGAGTAQGEGDLDIQMVLGMAPLCNLTIYDGGGSDLMGVLNQEANDNNCDIITESWGWNLPAWMAEICHSVHQSMSAQGITYMAASGDYGTTLEPYSYPSYDPEVLMVGGTVANVDSLGNRISEVGWSGSGGGWSTNTATFNTRPSYQTGNGVPTSINYRMTPDVSLNAGGAGAYQFYLNGSLFSGYNGTSFACPVFGGGLAVAQQKIISLGGLPPNGSGQQRFGRIQDLIYSQNGRLDVWTDITSGGNGNLPNGSPSNCTAYWDTVTGWGAINFDAFVNSQVSGVVPAVPTGLSATPGDSQVVLTWSSAAGATSYKIKRSTTNGGPYTQVGTSSSPTFTNTGLTNGTTYYYVVCGTNAAGDSGNSSQVSAVPNPSIPNPPTNLTATGGDAQVSLTWTASSGATSYKVKRSTTSGGPYTQVGTTASSSYSDLNLVNDTTYYYVVTANNAGGESGNSNQASATPRPAIPSPPTNLSAAAGDAQATLSWTASSGATSYKIKRSTTNGGAYTQIGTSSVASYSDLGLTNGTTYYYVVTASNTGGESGNSNQASATPNPAIPNPPTNLTATGGNAQASLTWTAVSGATSYKIKRSTTNGGPYTQVGTSAIASYTDLNLVNDTTYYYVVTANNAGGESGNSNQASATPRPAIPSPPAGLTATGGNAQVALTWTASSGATSYKVKRSTTNGGAYTQVGTSATASYTDLSVVNGTTYYYVVTANNTGGESGNSNQASATPNPAIPNPPAGLTASGGNSQVVLSWSPSSGATSYKVKRSTTNGGPYTQIGTSATPSYSDLSVVNGTTYYYVVTAANSGGESGNSNQASATPNPSIPSPPANLVAIGGNAQVGLSWNASAGATSYKVKRSTTNGGSYAQIGSVSSTAFTDLGVTNGTTYYYVVTASNVSGESGNSNQASATPSAPAPNPPTGLTAVGGDTMVTLNWNASSGATSYKIKRSLTNGGPYAQIGTSATPGYVDPSVTNGTTYYYVVAASNTGGDSANSSQASAVPTNSVMQILLNPGFELGTSNWSATNGIINSNSLQLALGGSWKAWLCGKGKSRQDTLYQQVTIPSTATSATLEFYLHIDTAEVLTSIKDKLTIQIRDKSNRVLKTLATYSNMNAGVGYYVRNFDVTAYKGKTIRVYLYGQENSSRQTSFVVDNFGLYVR